MQPKIPQLLPTASEWPRKHVDPGRFTNRKAKRDTQRKERDNHWTGKHDFSISYSNSLILHGLKAKVEP